MLYHFKSKAGDLTMLEPNGRQVLEILGKELTPKGVISADQIPAAISALQSAIAGEGGQSPAPGGGTNPEKDKEENVVLKQRAVPFIDLLKRAQDKGADVTWGV